MLLKKKGLALILILFTPFYGWSLNLERFEVYYDGPNCWGTTLKGLGVISEIRQVDYNEMLYWINTNCELVKSKKELKRGTVIVEYDIKPNNDNEGVLFHSFIYLDENTAYGKFSNSKEDQPQESSINQHRVYGSTDPVFGRAGQIDGIYSRAYNCKKKKAVYPEEIKVIFDKIDQVHRKEMPLNKLTLEGLRTSYKALVEDDNFQKNEYIRGLLESIDSQLNNLIYSIEE